MLASPQTTKERQLSFFNFGLATMSVLGFWNFPSGVGVVFFVDLVFGLGFSCGEGSGDLGSHCTVVNS